MAASLIDAPSLNSLGPASHGGPQSGLFAGEEDPDFVNEEDRHQFQCPVHRGVLHNTQQTPCGHRVCEECVGVWLNGESSKRCPVGEADCEDITLINVNPDRSVQRDLKRVQVFCKNKHEGCPEQMPLKIYRSHLEGCAFQRVPCEYSSRGCKERELRSKFNEHQAVCSFRPVHCRLCHKEISHQHLRDHDDKECEEKVTGCPFGCDNKELKRKEVTGHRDVCPVHPVDCKFKHMGCEFVGQKEVVEKHERDGLGQHLDLITGHMARLQQDVQTRQMTFSEEKDKLQQTLQSRSDHDEKTSRKVWGVENEVKDLKGKLVTALEKVIRLEHKMPELVERPLVASLEQDLRGLQQAVTGLEQGRGQGRELVVAGGSTLATQDNTPETVLNRLAYYDQRLQEHDIRMAENDLRFQLLETTCYDGRLVWKISNYSQRKRDAQNGRTLSVFSQPFYTHRFGYKMCGRVYLNGDGQGKTTHLSFFFVVMKGEYDPLLSWPFNRKVTLTLLDQSSERRHLSDSFVPDSSSTSFQRPTTEMNVASGCPLFVSHTVLENENSSYLKNDVIFLRLTVDPSPSPSAS